jgi:hypothetical protein
VAIGGPATVGALAQNRSPLPADVDRICASA